MKKIHKSHKAFSFSDFGSFEKENVCLRINLRNKSLNSSPFKTNSNKIINRKTISKMKVLSCEDLQNNEDFNNEIEKAMKARKKNVFFFFRLNLKTFLGKYFH